MRHGTAAQPAVSVGSDPTAPVYSQSKQITMMVIYGLFAALVIACVYFYRRSERMQHDLSFLAEYVKDLDESEDLSTDSLDEADLKREVRALAISMLIDDMDKYREPSTESINKATRKAYDIIQKVDQKIEIILKVSLKAEKF